MTKLRVFFGLLLTLCTALQLVNLELAVALRWVAVRAFETEPPIAMITIVARVALLVACIMHAPICRVAPAALAGGVVLQNDAFTVRAPALFQYFLVESRVGVVSKNRPKEWTREDFDLGSRLCLVFSDKNTKVFSY